jgi:outer membrane protein OmpA-like peptidoglycan-associated protein
MSMSRPWPALWVGISVLVLSAATASAGTLTVQTGSGSFPDTLVNTTAPMQTITIVNNGTDTVVTAVTEGTPNCDQFTASIPGGVTLGNNDTLVVTVTFTPTSTGAKTCGVLVEADAPAADLALGLDGDGIAPVMTTSADEIDFAGVAVTAGTSTQSFTVTNEGTATLNVDDIVESGAHGADFSFTTSEPLPAALAPDDILTVMVTFNPTAEGIRTATLTVEGDAPGDLTDTVDLTGTGQVRRITTSADLVFTAVSGSSDVDTIVVGNSGQIPLSLQSAAITGGSWFTFTNSPQASCAGSQSCDYSPDISINASATRNVGIQCVPPTGASGMQTATVTFTSNSDGTGSDNTVGLTCTASKPDIALSVAAFDFPNTNVGSNTTTTAIAVMNTGGAPLIFDITFTGANPGDFTYVNPQCVAVTSPCTINPGGMRTFTVRFTPGADGARSADMNFNSNDQDPGDATVQVELTGTGLGAEIVRTTASPMAFGAVPIGSFAELPLTVRNDGNVDLSVSALSVPNAVYTFTPAVPQTIPAGMTRTFTVRCTPTARQNYNGNLIATNNSYNTPSLSTAATCQGVSADLKVDNLDVADFDFGDQPEGSGPHTHPIVLRNAGELAANNITASFTVATAGYSIDPATPVPATLAAGGTANITVRFTPTATAQGGDVDLEFNADPQASFTPSLEDAELHLHGNAQSNGIDVDPGTVTFADTRWDQNSTETFLIANTGESTFDVTSLMLSNTIDFAVTQIAIDRDGNGSRETTQTTFAAFELLGGGDALVTVRFQPNDDMLGNLTGEILVVCDLAEDNMRTVTLSGNSVSPDLEVEPGMIVDFGNVDIDGDPATVVLSLNNVATSGTMNVNGNSGFAAPFTASGFTAGAVAPGASNTTTITYTPTVEADDELIVTYNVVGLFPMAGPTAVMITLRGRGTDRHIEAPGEVTFPPTYRHPTVPPELDVTIANTGLAALNLSAVMLSTDMPFELVNGDPVEVPGETSTTFRVRFNPTTAATFDEQLVVTHDDNGAPGAPMAIVNLHGMSIDREVMYIPTRNIGTAIVGSELRSEDLIELINQSNATDHPTTFSVRALEVADTSGVLVVDAAADRQIPAGETARFGATFTPVTAGPFTTTVAIFLDGDPAPHGTVTVTGHAVEVELQGGGCAAGGGAGGGATVLVIAGLAFALRRRRFLPARHAGAVLAIAVVAVAPAARADVTVQSFHPLPSIEDDLFEVESATVGEANAWAAGLAFTYAMDPLVSTITNCGGSCPDGVAVGDTASLVKQQSVLTVGGAYALAGRFELGLAVPLMMQSGDETMLGAAADGNTLGDIAAHGKVQLLRVGRFALGAAAVVTAPTAKDGEYAGYSGPSGSIELLTSYRARRLLVSLNAGFLGRETEEFATAAQGSAVTFGGGLGFRLLPALWLAAEVFGDRVVVDGGQTSVQALGGLRVRLDTFTIGLGGGAGLNKGIGVPKARGFLLLSYSPRMRPQEAIRPPPPPPDTRDTDGDGIRNVEDQCPNEAEDTDLFEDHDGCPDFDNDADGIADLADQCDDEAEDVDGFQDGDGCVDADNDGDGIADKSDVCPNELEDKDAHADLDGCPDDDNDHDGVADAQDKCVNQAESINGNKDDDGCPDRGDGLVLLAADRIELLDSVRFTGTTAKLGKGSDNVLGQVAATLRANPDIVRISVRAHVHPRWTRERDQTLSDDRAKAVRDWLVQWGIAPDRIDVRGFGSDKPLVKTAKKAEQINDRIEFIIMERTQ